MVKLRDVKKAKSLPQELMKSLLSRYDTTPFLSPITQFFERDFTPKTPPRILKSHERTWWTLFVISGNIVLYLVTSTAAVVIVKFMNYNGDFVYPVFSALLTRSSWVLNLLLLLYAWWSVRKIHLPDFSLIKAYAFLGAITTLSDLFNSWGMNYLSGSTYALLNSSDVIFNIILGRIFLKKQFIWLHYLSVFFVLASVCVTGIPDLKNAQLFGVISTILGGVMLAIEAVCSDKLLKDKGRKDKFLQLAEHSFFVSVYGFVGLGIPVLATGEYKQWTAALYNIERIHWVGLFVFSCLAITVSRFFVTTTKYYIIEKRSAFTFSLLKPMRRVCTIIFAVIAFSEPFNWMIGVGMVLAVVGFTCHVYAGYRIAKQQQAFVQKSLDEERVDLMKEHR